MESGTVWSGNKVTDRHSCNIFDKGPIWENLQTRISYCQLLQWDYSWMLQSQVLQRRKWKYKWRIQENLFCSGRGQLRFRRGKFRYDQGRRSRDFERRRKKRYRIQWVQRTSADLLLEFIRVRRRTMQIEHFASKTRWTYLGQFWGLYRYPLIRRQVVRKPLHSLQIRCKKCCSLYQSL